MGAKKVGRPITVAGRTREHQLLIRISDEEKAVLKDKATAAGSTMSACVYAALAEMIQEPSDSTRMYKLGDRCILLSPTEEKLLLKQLTEKLLN